MNFITYETISTDFGFFPFIYLRRFNHNMKEGYI